MKKVSKLSSRELEVVGLLQQGKSNKMIASALGISARTVEFHLKNIFRKYRVGSRMELVLQLGKSTVADGTEADKNDDRLSVVGWVKSFGKAVSGSSKELIMKFQEAGMSDGKEMTFQQAIITCLTRYADFNGRASRPEFWWFLLFVGLVATALAYLSGALSNIFLIAMTLPILAAGTRRLQDGGRSGWWQLFLLAPVAGTVLVGILWALPGSSQISEG